MLYKLKNKNNTALICICVIEELVTSQLLPSEYKDYMNIFNANIVTQLPIAHKGLNHEIKLKLNTTPPYRPLYNLLETELYVLHNYLKTNLAFRFI